MSKKIVKEVVVMVDEFHYHEAIDRIYIIENCMDSLLLEHVSIQEHKDVLDRLKKASELLIESYQLMNGYRIKRFDQSEQK